MHRLKRVLLCAAIAVPTSLVVVGFGQSAQAMNYTSAGLTAWAYTDSAQPAVPAPDPDGYPRIGTIVDTAGVPHTGRAYFTYDLTPYRGQVLHQANFYSSERTVEDCTQTAPVQVWRTRPVTGTTTWQAPPRELELIAERTLGKGTICPGAYLGIDVLPQINAAIARHDKTITLEVRAAAAGEADPGRGRTMRRFDLSVWTNHPPTVKAQKLLFPERGCGTLAKHPTAGGITSFSAQSADADPFPAPTVTFEMWPVDKPEQRAAFGETSSINARVTEDLRGYADGTVLAWTVRARDHDDAGPWGRTCYLTVDNTAPAAAPAVSSRKYGVAEYPGAGGPGVAGTFVLDALGDRDVVAFTYDEGSGRIPTEIAANHPGGRAKVSVTPRSWGAYQIKVRSIDGAGNRGPERVFAYYVRNTAPFAEIDVAGVGLTSHITLTSNASDVTSFGYSVADGPETRVPAVDGRGTGELVFTRTGFTDVLERSYVGRKLIGTYTQEVLVTDSPGIASDEFSMNAGPVLGEAGSFTFTPRTTGVVAYLYDFGDGDQQRVAAAGDGTAVLRWTPPRAGYLTIAVSSVNADGVVSQQARESFIVIDTHPTVYTDAGSSWPDNDGVGRPVIVNMYSDLPDVTGFVYSFDGGPEKTTTDGGYASIEVVPTHAGDSSFTARARLADGTTSPATTVAISITSAPLASVKGPYGDSPVLGRDATLTLEPGLPGVTGYRYSWGDDEERTVSAGPDGSATVTLTPGFASYQELRVSSVSADGTVSDVRRLATFVDDPAVQYTGSWDDWSPSGGVGVPGRLGFYGDLIADTVKYLWQVNDGPVQEVVPAEGALVTDVAYTPDRNGASTVHVQRVFSDGAVSPMAEYTLLVGTMPLVQSDVYRAGGWNGGPGVTGIFHFSGGMPGVVSYEYRFTDDSAGTEAADGTVAADGTGAADVRFTPTDSHMYTITVVGHRADGTATDRNSFWFGVS
jgi:hypothetical protein